MASNYISVEENIHGHLLQGFRSFQEYSVNLLIFRIFCKSADLQNILDKKCGKKNRYIPKDGELIDRKIEKIITRKILIVFGANIIGCHKSEEFVTECSDKIPILRRF